MDIVLNRCFPHQHRHHRLLGHLLASRNNRPASRPASRLASHHRNQVVSRLGSRRNQVVSRLASRRNQVVSRLASQLVSRLGSQLVSRQDNRCYHRYRRLHYRPHSPELLSIPVSHTLYTEVISVMTHLILVMRSQEMDTQESAPERV